MQNFRFIPTTLLALATVAACSSVPKNSRLNEARSDFNDAQNTPRVVHLAPTELKQAGNALAKANDAAAKKEDEARVTHLAYVAKQRTAVAQETAKQKEAEIAVANAGRERDKIRLDARTQEADKAQKKAEASLRRAEDSQQQADASQRRAEDSQRAADASQQQAAVAQQQAELSQQQTLDAEKRNDQLEAQLKELNAKKTDRGLVITLGDILFDTNKADLKSGASHSLKKIAGFLTQYPQRMARIEGYTDNTGSTDYNQDLSNRRANAVRTSLVDMGIGSERITTQGFGKGSPIASNTTATGRQMNRRVEIIVSDDKGDVSSR